jgi:hypothetical protein
MHARHRRRKTLGSQAGKLGIRMGRKRNEADGGEDEAFDRRQKRRRASEGAMPEEFIGSSALKLKGAVPDRLPANCTPLCR